MNKNIGTKTIFFLPNSYPNLVTEQYILVVKYVIYCFCTIFKIIFIELISFDHRSLRLIIYMPCLMLNESGESKKKNPLCTKNLA